jgi:GT2 family glycosyltransferase
MTLPPLDTLEQPQAGEGPRSRSPLTGIGVVVIGRNEGDRLRRCLLSLVGRGLLVVYVDSGSTDGSVALARAHGAEIVDLDLSIPFTAARARNAGVERLLQVDPNPRFVQFVDGDCEIIDGWWERAVEELERRPEVAVVCGRLRERFPERSIYNRLADIEWDTPIGETKACGGIVLMRVDTFRQTGGFDSAIIAGEEGELCLRLRRRGWKIVGLDAEMALHDMAMTRFVQWWRRAFRSGHAYAEGFARHGWSPDRHCVPEARSIAFWGGFVPLLAAAAAWPTRGASLVLLAGYPLLTRRIVRRARARGLSPHDAQLYARFCVLAKFPQVLGMTRYWFGRLVGIGSRLIEYKACPPPPKAVRNQ